MGYRSVVVATMSAALLTFGTVGSPEAGAQLLSAPTLTVSPESAEVGETVQVSGHCDLSYFPEGPTPTVELVLETNPATHVADVPYGQDGDFSASVTVPNVPVGSYDLGLQDASCAHGVPFDVVPAPVQPTLVLNPTSGHVGDGVSATGACPVDTGSVEIFFGNTSMGSTTVDSSTGEFGTTFTVPQIAPGSYDVNTSCEASAPFDVLIIDVPPTLVLDPTSGHVGDGVTATGTCPVDSGSVEIFFGNTSVGSTTVDSSTGEFGTTFPVPGGPPGSHDVSTSCKASAPFDVLIIDVPPTLVLNPTSGHVGDGVTATGTCPVDSGSVEVLFERAPVDVATVDRSTGEFSVAFAVPDASPRSYDVTSDCGGGASFEVLPVEATLGLDPASGQVGDGLTATGTCPASSESVEIAFGNTFVGYAAVDSSTGEFGPVGFPVPDVPLGFYDVTSDCGGRASFEVLSIEPTLDLVPASGHGGDKVSATGTCPVSSRSVEIFFEGEAVGSESVNSSTGKFGSVDFDVPVVEPGTHEVTTDCGGRASFAVPPVGTIPATLELDPAEGRLGVDVTASGRCPLDHPDVTLLLDDRTIATTGGDPKTGKFTVVFPMLGVKGPTHTVTTSCGVTAEFTVLFPSPSTHRPGRDASAGSGTSARPDTRGRPNRPLSQLPRPKPVDTPQGARIVVPDLTGLTEDEVITSLGDLLTLVERTGEPGVVARQLPLAGTLVEPASDVSILLAEPGPVALQSGTSRFPLAVLAVLVGALIGALLSAERVRRRRLRERRWVDTDVRTELETAEPALPDVPDGSSPALDVRLELHRDPKHL